VHYTSIDVNSTGPKEKASGNSGGSFQPLTYVFIIPDFLICRKTFVSIAVSNH
jgi:hypothetical protein